MRESLMYGSVRGARGNSRPYRDKGGASSSRFSAARRRLGRSRRARSSWRNSLASEFSGRTLWLRADT